MIPPTRLSMAAALGIRIEQATIQDLNELTDLVMNLLDSQGDFEANRLLQERGIQLILENPKRGRIFVLRNDDHIFGMVNLLFNISTALGGFVITMEDVIVHPDHRAQGYGALLVEHVIQFAKDKKFLRITLLTDKISSESQSFFKKHGFEYSNMIPMRLLLDQ